MVIRIKQQNRNILVDCGQIAHIAKRVLKATEALFISHAHMDHFIGIDAFTRSVLVSNRTIDLYGPPKIAEKLALKLKGYNWNLVEDHFCSFRVFEVYPEEMRQFRLDGSKQFQLEEGDIVTRNDKILCEDSNVRVEGEICDHKIPVLIFKFIEKQAFQLDESKLNTLGYQKGPWISELKDWFYGDRQKENPTCQIKHLSSRQSSKVDLKTLYDSIQCDHQELSIGYITDIVSYT